MPEINYDITISVSISIPIIGDDSIIKIDPLLGFTTENYFLTNMSIKVVC